MKSARTTALISAGLVLLSLIAYARLWENDFIDLDDEKYITANPHVLDGLTVDGVRWAWSTNHAGFWLPLVWMSLQIDGEFSHSLGANNGLLPWVYHGQNLFWHIATVVLLFLILFRMTNRIGRSALVAALFAVHPLHVESVAWATERKDVLSAFFLMLTIFTYARYTEKPSVRRYVLVLLSFILGLLAKPMLVTLPCALLLLDFWPLQRYGWKNSRANNRAEAQRGLWKILVEKIPLFLLAIAASLLAIQAQSHERAVVSLTSISIPSRLANAAISYAWYVDKTIWPSDLAAFYPHAMNNWTWLPVLVSVALLVVLSSCAFALARRAPWFLVGWLWFLGTLVPAIGFVQVGAQARADRFVYIPHIGLFIALVWSVAAVLDREKVGVQTRVALASICVLMLTIATVVQVGYWKNSQTMWTHTLTAIPENDLAHSLLGRSLMREYQTTGNREYLDRAIEHFREAVRINPNDPYFEFSLQTALQSRGK